MPSDPEKPRPWSSWRRVLFYSDSLLAENIVCFLAPSSHALYTSLGYGEMLVVFCSEVNFVQGHGYESRH